MFVSVIAWYGSVTFPYSHSMVLGGLLLTS